jgi:hypothetical protein
MFDLKYIFFSLLSVWLFFFLIFIFLMLGRRWRIHKSLDDDTSNSDDVRILETTIYTIMGLLIAFTFSGANSRSYDQRNITIDQVNAINSVYYALDVIPVEARRQAIQYLSKYIAAQIKWYNFAPDRVAMEKERQNYLNLEKKLWQIAINTCNQPHSTRTCSILLSSLNQMIIFENKKILYKSVHPPIVIYVLLLCIVLLGSFLAGYRIKGELRETAIYMFIFSAILSIMLFIIINLEFPRIGVFSVDIFGNYNDAFAQLQTLVQESTNSRLADMADYENNSIEL